MERRLGSLLGQGMLSGAIQIHDIYTRGSRLKTRTMYTEGQPKFFWGKNGTPRELGLRKM